MKVETSDIEIMVPVMVKVKLASHMRDEEVELSEVFVTDIEHPKDLSRIVDEYINDDVERGDNPVLKQKLEEEFVEAFQRTAEDEDYYYKLNSRLDVYA